jgi:hypothetical protein
MLFGIVFGTILEENIELNDRYFIKNRENLILNCGRNIVNFKIRIAIWALKNE